MIRNIFILLALLAPVCAHAAVEDELRSLRETVAALVALLSPWISTSEMCARYDCDPRTLNRMERDGRIPFRKNGKWSRNEVRDFEANSP